MKKRIVISIHILVISVFFVCPFAFAADTEISYSQYHAAGMENAPAGVIFAEGKDAAEQIGGKAAYVIPEGSSRSFTFSCTEEGWYRLQLTYYPVEGKALDIEYGVMLDGAAPFSESNYLTLNRIWKDDNAPGEKKDAAGNDIIPGQHEEREWITVFACDHTGIENDPYCFYLTEGEHEVSFASKRETLVLAEAAWCNPPQIPSYDTVSAMYEQNGWKDAGGETIAIEAEITYRKSDTVLYARTDRSSPLTTPYSTRETRLNTIGGNSWATQGQWIEWEFEVPADGLYYLSFRARQDILSGSFVTRKIYIDGEIPFTEFANVKIAYDPDWQIIDLPQAVFLTTGRHVLRMEATIGELSELVSIITDSVYQLNSAYRRIVMMTGTTPDIYRDYSLEENIPEIFDIFSGQIGVLEYCDTLLEEKTGKRGSMNSTLQTLRNQLEDFCEKPETVQKRLSTYKDNIGALGSWLVQIRQLPLEIDRIYIRGTAAPLAADAEAGFFAQIGHEFDMFISSFVIDYNVIGTLDTGKTSRTIEVWVSAGRDQANIIKQMIENDFTPATGITVNLKLVPGQLMNATAAGVGPDVVLQLGNSEPVNYAVRKAAYDLTEFSDFEEVAARFRESAMVPYQLEGGVYALPETQTFSVMFYRTDILNELGLEPPETWDEMFYVVGRLQRKNMTVGIQPPNSAAGSYQALSTMAMLLYQRNGEMYLDGNKRSGLSSLEAKEAFTMWVSLYSDYELPVKYDALTRFRSGEMPVVIEDFTFYNLLQVAAPEIRGIWSFTIVPGTPDEEGNVNHSVSGTGICTMMLADADDKDAAWTFMKWWTGAGTQTEYGRNIENQLGVSARYPSANIEAFGNMPWSAAELAILDSQWYCVKGIPEVPGGYFTARHLNNAFRRVINNREDPGETLLDYVKKIDEEITTKRKEFGLEVSE
ncbi:MAG: ABC transporter substrate-binding protein [Clostridiales bacterium]|nr:ABC transporter substrate-binding protein [Clostridiales bacterium]